MMDSKTNPAPIKPGDKVEWLQEMGDGYQVWSKWRRARLVTDVIIELSNDVQLHLKDEGVTWRRIGTGTIPAVAPPALDPGTRIGMRCPSCKGVYCTDRCFACTPSPAPSGVLTEQELDAVLETWVQAPFPSGVKTPVEEKNAGLRQLAQMAAEAQLRKIRAT
jgi:hypothetical protein